LAGLKWTDIDFERRLICVQRSFSGPTKSIKTRHVPLLDPLFDILLAWKRNSRTHWVFPNNSGNMLKKSSRIFQERLQAVLNAAGFEQTQTKGKPRHYIVFHSLRHTFASHWIMNGGDIYKLQKILGHESIRMTEKYSHLAPHAFAEDFTRLSKLSPPSDADVIPLRAKL